MYKKLGLPSKLARYALQVGFPDVDISGILGDYDKIIALVVNETTPLADWILHLLKQSEAVCLTGKSFNNVLSELQVNEFQNVKCLGIGECDSVTHLLKRTHEVINFPNLYDLKLGCLECLTHFCSDHVEGIEFLQLRKMFLIELPKFQNFWPTTNKSNLVFHEKVSCSNLEELYIEGANSMSALCSHQLPTDYFTKLETLKVYDCGKLRNLMSPSVARGLLNLRKLKINDYESIEEVIIEEEQQGEGIMTLFPRLEELKLVSLPKLGHFFLTKQALKFPLLRKVKIEDCPEMKMFVKEGICVSTPSLQSVMCDENEVKVDDLNKLIHQRFTSKEQ